MIGQLRQGNWLLTLPLAAVGIGYLYFFFLPAKAEIARRRTELASRTAQIDQLRPLKIAIFEKETEVEAAEKFVADWTRRNENGAAVMAEINQKVNDSGAQTIRFDRQPTTRLRAVQQTPLQLGTAGNFAQLFELLRGLEALPATLWIDQLTIRAPAKQGEPLASEVNLVIFGVNRDNSD